MLEEVGSKPGDVSGFNQTPRIHQLLAELPTNQSLWDERSPLNYVPTLATLSFRLQLYWSSADIVVGNQATEQSGKLYAQIKAAHPAATVTEVVGTWTHSDEFVPRGKLAEALTALGLIGV